MEYLSLAVAVPAFAYASIGDLKNRRVSNKVWLALLPIATALFIINFQLGHLVTLGVVAAILYLFLAISKKVKRTSLQFRGADFKASLILTLLFPLHVVTMITYGCVASLGYHLLRGRTIPFIPCLLVGVIAFTVITL